MAIEDMSNDRWQALMQGIGDLTDEEIAEGWHYCWDWDGLLIHPDMPEAESCACK